MHPAYGRTQPPTLADWSIPKYTGSLSTEQEVKENIQTERIKRTVLHNPRLYLIEQHGVNRTQP